MISRRSPFWPRCACGCGQRAMVVADVCVDGGLDCRQPWYSELHARGACDDETRVQVSVVVATEDLGAVIEAGPCWCGLREHTTCDWCPQHGAVGSRVADAGDRSLADTQPMQAIADVGSSARSDLRSVVLRYLEMYACGVEADGRNMR